MSDKQYFFPDALIEQALDSGVKNAIIGFCGKSGVGKDTGAEFLAKEIKELPYSLWYGYILSFATPLKMACAALSLPFSLEETEDDEFFNYSHPVVKNNNSILGRSRKEIAQFVGTELIRNHIHPNFWVASLAGAVKRFNSSAEDVVLISDVRFQNEIDWIISQGGIVIHVSRDTPERGITGHISDQTHLLDISKGVHIHVENNGTLEEYKSKLKEILKMLTDRNFEKF